MLKVKKRRIFSEDHCKKISEANKGKIISKKQKKKISESHKGKPCSEETKKKISMTLLGRHISEETKKKMSDSHKNKIFTEKHKKKISESHKGKNMGVNNHNFGKPRSEETRLKISIANKGKSHKKGVNSPNFGKHHSEEHKKKISISEIGKYVSEETKKKMAESRKGKDNPSWKGGISFEPYCSLFNEKFKEKIRNQFGRQCFICGSSEELNGRKLPIHHINYNKNCLCDDTKCYFIPLCSSCHSRTNFNRVFWDKLLTACCKDSLMLEYF